MALVKSTRARSRAIFTALAKEAASAPPWLFTTMPLSPRNGPPFTLEGSSLRAIRRRAPWAMKAPSLEVMEEVRASRISARKNRASPSPVFRATLPVKPSVTTTSTVPLAMSSPSTKP